MTSIEQKKRRRKRTNDATRPFNVVVVEEVVPFLATEEQNSMFARDKTVADNLCSDRTSMDCCIDSTLENIVVVVVVDVDGGGVVVVDLQDLTTNSTDLIQLNFLPSALEYVEHDTNLVRDNSNNLVLVDVVEEDNVHQKHRCYCIEDHLYSKDFRVSVDLMMVVVVAEVVVEVEEEDEVD